MAKYCPLGFINGVKGFCEREDCAWWSAYKQCCGLLLFADTIARLEEKLPSYGKPVITNTTARDARLKEARARLKHQIPFQQADVEDLQRLEDSATSELIKKTFHIQAFKSENLLNFLEELLELLQEDTT